MIDEHTGIVQGEIIQDRPRIKISDIVQHPEQFGVIAVMPQPDTDTAPLSPFRVEWTSIRPDQRYGELHVSLGDTRNPSNRQLKKNDLILHAPTGVYARVVERIRHNQYRIEAWSAPHTEEDQAAWVVNEGRGDWVCWGVAYETEEDLPWHVPQTVDTPEEMEAARKDLFRYPERQGWAGRFHVGKNWKQMTGKQRKKARAQLRKMLGVCHELQNKDSDTVMAENTRQRYTTKLGSEVVRWTMGADGTPTPE